MSKFYYIPLYGLMLFSFNSFNGGLYAAQLSSSDTSSTSSKESKQTSLNHKSTFIDNLIEIESSCRSFEGEKDIFECVNYSLIEDLDDKQEIDDCMNSFANSLFAKIKKGDRLVIDGTVSVLGVMSEITDKDKKEEDSYDMVYSALVSFLGTSNYYKTLAQALRQKYNKHKNNLLTDQKVKEVLKNVVKKIIETEKKQENEDD